MRFLKVKQDKQWHDWFAWRPVFTPICLVWLETVRRSFVSGKPRYLVKK